MDANDIIEAISKNLSERKSSAALSNYEVLCNNIDHLNKSLDKSLSDLAEVLETVTTELSSDTRLAVQFQKGAVKAPFTAIIPTIIRNSLSILRKFVYRTAPDDRNGVTIETVGKLRRDFDDYNELATTVRQVVDSLVSDGYQMLKLDARELNYHVLVSLNSFDRFATRSLRQTLFNQEVEDTLNEFRQLPFAQWKNSTITRCEQPTFANKVDFILGIVRPVGNLDLAGTLKDLFKFSSEFTHIGYVSTFFTSGLESEVILGDVQGPYFPSTENFSELKYEMLAVVIQLLADLYLPCLVRAFDDILVPDAADPLRQSLEAIGNAQKAALASRNSEYYFFIKYGLIGSEESIPLTCRCGRTRDWEHPHNPSDLFCSSCGSGFRLLEIAGDGGYVFTSEGPIKIIGNYSPPLAG
ncbi:hypothetical protein ABC977_08145 [Thioalkalicoccus limnaeus]|uniref:Uncharacterized protein n=1 Tax=Thioalkalicoccus limnaeus TaxID=120681 RepID=A0ABV4BCY0_9GAMM